MTLMPWLVKYRVFHEKRCSDSLKDAEIEKQIKLDEERDVAEIMADVAKETGAGVVDAANAGIEVVEDGAGLVVKAGAGAVNLGVGAVGGGAALIAETGKNVANAGKGVVAGVGEKMGS